MTITSDSHSRIHRVYRTSISFRFASVFPKKKKGFFTEMWKTLQKMLCDNEFSSIVEIESGQFCLLDI